MRILVITQGNDAVYGASTSLKLLLRNCGWDFDLVYSRYIFHHTSDEDMKKYTDYKAGHVYCLFLPFVEKSFLRRQSLYNKLRYAIFRILIFADSFKLRKIIRKGNYDYILLNSLVQYPLINRKNKYIIMIREMCTAKGLLKKKIVSSLNQADRMVYIDPSLKPPLRKVKTKSIVLNNPFDMSSVREISRLQAVQRLPQMDTEKIVITLAGILAPQKGTDFVIKAFKKIVRNDILLVIAGNGGDENYNRECKELAAGCENICLMEEQKDMRYVYLLTDYVLRADEFFATGRTVYEGLYAGCNVIIQSDSEKNKKTFQEYRRFQDKIFFYDVRDIKSLASVIESLPEHKVTEREFISNIDEYVSRFNEFITGRKRAEGKE